MSSGETPPGTALEATELLGTMFADRYRMARLVSEGANTTVFDADDIETGRTVTVKLIRPEMTTSPSFRRRFEETMRSVAALSHPNIAAVYDWGISAVGDVSTAHVVVEQLTGGSLRDMFDRARLLSPSQALAVGLDACRGLDYAHRRGFVHSELTPSKLVFGDDRRLRITDFGLARLLNEPAWQQPDSVPTHVAWYASPEQGRVRGIDDKTDVYALCLTLHEAVTGALPFRHDSTVASLAARIGKLMPVSADLGPLAAVLEHAGRPEADERSSAAEFGRELVRAASKLPRPEPLPLLSTGLFDTPMDRLRTPDDPTGGVVRPSDELVITVVDEPDAPRPDEVPLEGAVDAHAADAAPAAGAADDAAARSVGAPEGRQLPETDEAGFEPVDDDGDDSVVDVEDVADVADVADVDSVVDVEDVVDSEPVEPVDDDGDGDDSVEDLVILPLDSDYGDPATGTSTTTSVAPIDPGRVGADTDVMPIVVEQSSTSRRRHVPWKILLALIVLGALGALGLLALRLFETPVYTVPDLVELPEAEALNVIATNEWQVTRTRERSDLVPTVGRVVRTAPAAGNDLAEGEPFLMVISEGPLLRELPDAAGRPLSEAQTALIERDLLATTTERFDEDVPEGSVIEWSVPGDATLVAGSQVEPGTTVELVVSIGPEPRTVPNVVGKTFDAARAELSAMRLELTLASQVFSDDVPLGSIVSQATEPETTVERGTEIPVVVSRGPDIVPFPDLSGAATYEEAARILFEAGFEPRLTFGDAQGEVRRVRIDGDEPEVGETFRRGTQVDIQAL